MAVKWPVFIIMMYCIGVVVCGVIEYFYFTQGATDSLFNLMNSVHGISFTNPLTALTDILIGVWSITQIFFHMLLWDYSFFTGGFEIVKYIVFWPLSIGFFLSLILAVKGTSSA